MKKTKEEALKTRAALLDAAENLFYEKGVMQTTLAQIAAEADMTRGAIYWHFKNKTEILTALVERVRTPTKEMMYQILNVPDDGDLVKACCALEELTIQCILQMVDDPQVRRVYTILLLRCGYSEEMELIRQQEQEYKARILEALTAFFTKMKKQRLGRADMEPRLAALAIFTSITGVCTAYLQYSGHYNMPDDAAALIRPIYKNFVGIDCTAEC